MTSTTGLFFFFVWAIAAAACCLADSSVVSSASSPKHTTTSNLLVRQLHSDNDYHKNTYDPWSSSLSTAEGEEEEDSIGKTTDESLSKEIPWGTINIMVVTDVHSWIAGNHRDDPRHWPYDAHRQPSQDADYGDVLSFYRNLEGIVSDHNNNNDDDDANNKRDLFFVMNGDFVDGTGLSGFPPTHLTPLLENMPWDAMNIGNHELYHDETVHFLAEEERTNDNNNDSNSNSNTDTAVRWKHGSYLSSNTVLSGNNDQPLVGNRYVYLEGKNTGTTILAFGFLYDFHEGGPSSTTISVEDTIREEWFSSVLGDQAPKPFDAILVLAHMDCLNPLVDVLLEGIRSSLPVSRRFSVPIQFVTGHTHRRCHSKLDEQAESFEAGRFLDTIGFVSLDIEDGSSTSTSTKFQHRFLDANRNSLHETLVLAHNNNKQQQFGLDFDRDFGTPDGRALSRSIAATRAELGIETVLGCSPRTYGIFEHARVSPNNTKEPLPLPAHRDPESLWHVYLREMIPNQLLAPIVAIADDTEPEPIFVAGSGTLRYSLFEGPITVNDLVAIDPFGNTVSELVSSSTNSIEHKNHEAVGLLPIYGWQLERLLEAANEFYNNVAEYGMPCFVLSGRSGSPRATPPPISSSDEGEGLGDDADVSIDRTKAYRVFATTYDAKRLLKVLAFLNEDDDNGDERRTTIEVSSPPSITKGRSYELRPACLRERTTDNDCTTVSMDLWKEYVREEMSCESVASRETNQQQQQQQQKKDQHPALRWGFDGSHSLDAVSAQILQSPYSSAATARVHSRMTPAQEEAASLANDQRAAVILVAGAILLIAYLLVFPPEQPEQPLPGRRRQRKQITTEQKLSPPPQPFPGRWRDNGSSDDDGGVDIQLIPLCRRNTDNPNQGSYGSMSI